MSVWMCVWMYLYLYVQYVRTYVGTSILQIDIFFTWCSFNACFVTGSYNYSMPCVVFCTVCRPCALLLFLSVGVSASVVFQQAHSVCSEAVYCSATAERQLLLASQGVVVVCPSYLSIHTYVHGFHTLFIHYAHTYCAQMLYSTYVRTYAYR